MGLRTPESLKTERIHMKNILRYAGYGIGALGMDLSYGLFYSFLGYYLTDTLYLHPIFIMVIAFVARVWDGINDPMMGAIVDRTNSRFGKYRRWILIGSAANAVVLVLLFTNPGFSTGAQGNTSIWLYVYVSVMYILWGMTNTMMDIPYWSMVPSLTNDPKQRNIAATVPRAFSGFGQVIIAMATPLVVPLLGGQEEGYNAAGFRRWALICGVILIGLILVAFRSTGKIPALVNTKPSQNKITARAVLDTLRSNDQLLIFMLVALLMNTGWYTLNGLATHYFERVVVENSQSVQSIFSLIVGVGQAAGLFLLPVLTKWLKRNTVIKIAMSMAGVGYLGMYFFRNTFAGFAVFCIIGMIGVGSSFVAQTIMLSDIVDYGEVKQGRRSDAVTFSMKGFLQKGAYTLQAIAMYLMLHFTHYDGSLAVQPQSAKTGITVMMLLVPPVLTALSLLVFHLKYKLDETKMAEVRAALNA